MPSMNAIAGSTLPLITRLSTAAARIKLQARRIREPGEAIVAIAPVGMNFEFVSPMRVLSFAPEIYGNSENIEQAHDLNRNQRLEQRYGSGVERAGSTNGGSRPWQKVDACRQRYRACQDPSIHPEFLIQRQQGGNRNKKDDCAGAVEV